MNSKSHNLFSLQNRILALLLIILFVFCVVFLRLGIIQIINGNWLQNKALDQWTRDLPIIAERGYILDTNGSELAISHSSYSIYARAKEIKNATSVAQFLANNLKLKFSNVFEKITNRGISESLVSLQVDTDIALKIFEKNYDGIYIVENSKRYYSYGDLLTQVLGFVTIDNIGQAGIENYFDEYLKGKAGCSLVQSDLTGVSLKNMMDYYISATSGYNVNLTIDVNIQLIVEQALNKALYEQVGKSASCIVMKANSGEIVAMSTKPSFNLNNIPRDNVNELMSMVKNNMVVDIYEPGSTFKIITIATALATGAASLNDHFYCPGHCIVDGERIKCWKSIGHGSQTLAKGFANSCNCVFTTLAQKIGLASFYEYVKNFGYGTPSGIEISGESSGILMKQSSVKTVDLARMGFGQAIAVTQLQHITAACAAVNGGTLYQPYLIKSITDKSGNVIKEYSPIAKKRVISSEISNIVNELMELAVNKTGKYIFIPGYNVGGKTGTTQKYENGGIAQGKYISSFVGTYPADNPEYVVLFAVDEPGAGAYYGSIVAVPYAKEILNGLFEYYDIKPDDPELAEIKPKEFIMPDFTNLSLTSAVGELSKLGLEYEIDGYGSSIISQLPVAGATAYSNDTIVLITN
ncbi:MAG: penicillin-binding transpeptidase domain-containing protein [Clostridia bacterium]|nr:penicillin-binding transpeptidase domain-containing protein [Clostridia bacterium]MDD4685943.1 penicillin-binding transpeptidase domain-containing protein [Clostridia bacterium]